MQKGRRISDGAKAAAVKDVANGEMQSVVAKRHNVSTSALSKWCKAAGVKPVGRLDRRTYDFTEMDKILGKEHDTDVARLFDVSTSFVRNRRVDLKIPPIVPPNSEKGTVTVDRVWQPHYDLQDIMKTWSRSDGLREFIEELRWSTISS